MANIIKKSGGTGGKSPYTRLTYIESTGTQYIDLGISVPHASERIIIEFAPTDVGYDNVICGHNADSWSWDTNVAMVLNSNILVANTTVPAVSLNTFCKFEYTSTYAKINDGEAVTLQNLTYTDGYNNTLLYASTKYGKHRVKSYQLYNRSTLVRYLIPCKYSGGAIGMYDLVNNKFYGNAGTGSFIAGDEVDDTTSTLIIDGVEQKENTFLATTIGDYENYTSISTLPHEFCRGCAVVYNGEIHIFGGDTSYYSGHYKWNGSSWVSVSTIPFNLAQGNAVVYKNEIHLMGSSVTTSGEEHYKWNGSSWTEVSSLPYQFYYGGAVVYNDEIHIMGTGVSLTSPKKYHYKWNGSSWSSVSTLPFAFQRGDAVVYNNEIHILGSYTQGKRTVHYKWDGSEWTSVSTIPYDFYDGEVVKFKEELHILGSYSSSYRTCHYKLDDSEWVSISTLPYNFYQGSAVVLDTAIHILGGSGDETSHYSLNYSKIYRKVGV